MQTGASILFRDLTEEEGLRVVAQTRTWLGVPYRWGGIDRRGADCSGAVWKIFEEAGLPYEYARTVAIPTSPFFVQIESPRAGDLIVWGPDSKTPHHGHVAIFDPLAGGGHNAWSSFDQEHPFGPRDYRKRRGAATFWRVQILEEQP